MKEYYSFYRAQLAIWLTGSLLVYLFGIVMGRTSLFFLLCTIFFSPFLFSEEHHSLLAYLKSMFTSAGLIRMIFLPFAVLFVVESVFLIICVDYYFDGATTTNDLLRSFSWVALSASTLFFFYWKKMVLKINDEGVIISVAMLIVGIVLQYVSLGYFYSAENYFGSPLSSLLDSFCLGNFIFFLNSLFRFKSI